MDFSRKVSIENGGSMGYDYKGRDKNEVVVETSWVCDPEDESNGEWFYRLHTVDEALECNIDIDIEG